MTVIESATTLRPYAARSTRLLGQFVDGIIGVAPMLAMLLVAGFIPVIGVVLYFVGIAWAIFYYFLADGFSGGQSYAKRWLGISVVDADTGKPCTFLQSFIRNLLLSVLGPIDWVFIFGEKHQRLGDKAAGTIVIAD